MNRKCMTVPSSSPCSSGLEKQRSNYYLFQTLPNGFYVTDALISIIQSYKDTVDVTLDCPQLIKSFLCATLYAPCNNVTGQPLVLCPASCQVLISVFNGSQCQYALTLLKMSSNDQNDQSLLSMILNHVNCTVPETYFFGNTSLGFSNNTCYSLIDVDDTSTGE